MADATVGKGAGMRTLIQVGNANCTHCLNEVLDELRTRPLVRNVHASAVAGCLEVEHDHDDPLVFANLLRQSLHGWAVADNGEIIMIATTSEVSDHCVRHSAEVQTADRQQGQKEEDQG